MTSLNPVLSIGVQLTENMQHHLGQQGGGGGQSDQAAGTVGISSPVGGQTVSSPFEGGCANASIALALACDPADHR